MKVAIGNRRVIGYWAYRLLSEVDRIRGFAGSWGLRQRGLGIRVFLRKKGYAYMVLSIATEVLGYKVWNL